MRDRDKRNGRSDRELLEPKIIDGKVPPHDLDAEAAVLSAIMLDPTRLGEILWLRPEHFYSGAHQRIWEAILYLRAAGEKIDVVTIGTWLKNRERIVEVGGMGYLTDLLNAAPAVQNVASYARTVSDKFQVRQLIATCQILTARGYLEGERSLLAEAEQAVTAVARSSSGRVTLLTTEEIFAPLPPEPPYLCKGLGLVPGRVVVIGGAPDSGKTLGVQSIGISVAGGKDIWGVFQVQRPGPVCHLNWDQPDFDTKQRDHKLARGLGLDVSDFGGRLRLANKPGFTLDDPSGLGELRALARDYVMIIIDALTGASGDIDENSPAIGRMLYTLGAISEETGCVILVIHHASKAPPAIKGRPVERDPLSMLRGSGSIGGAAGGVFIQRTIKSGELYGVTMARPPTSMRRKLEPFALRFEDLVDDDGNPIDAVRVTYVDPEELAALTKKPEKAAPAQAPDRTKEIEAIAARVLQIIKMHPRSGTGTVQEKAPKMHKGTFNAALEHLWQTKQIADALGGVHGDRKKKEWVAT